MTNNPNILMFGWEYPPFNSGGLGTACHGLTHALADENVNVTFVLPHKVNASSDKVNLAFADQKEITLEHYRMMFNPYINSEMYKILKRKLNIDGEISDDLIQEVHKYSINARKLAENNSHDIIHAHDWLSFGAGMEAKRISNKPLVLHVHATEFDRTGFTGAHPHIYAIEKEGMKRADKVIAVSGYTRDVISKHYKIPRHKIDVVHNGINLQEYTQQPEEVQKLKEFLGKIVLFVGRLTLQKGPDYFMKAARKVLEYDQNVTFIIAGSGDAEHQVIQQAAHYGISHKFYFTGFLRGKELNQIYQAADVYVMSSVSEPFGISCLEAMANGSPVLISQQSGVAECITNALKVNFWDTDEMANKILSILHHGSLYETLRNNGLNEVKRFTWGESARKCRDIYQQLLP